MNSKSGVEYARTFFTRENSNDYDKLVRVTTLGRDAIWKKKIVSYIPGNSYVLDLACGTGILSSMLIEKQNDVLGVDLTFGYLEIVNTKRIQMDLVNANAELLPFVENAFDCVVTSYLPKYTNLDSLINECFRVLKVGGCVILHDFTCPKNSLYRFAWNNYFGLIKRIWKQDRKWKNVFADLGTLIKENDWDLRVENVLKALGFTNIGITYLTFQTSLIVTATKK